MVLYMLYSGKKQRCYISSRVTYKLILFLFICFFKFSFISSSSSTSSNAPFHLICHGWSGSTSRNLYQRPSLGCSIHVWTHVYCYIYLSGWSSPNASLSNESLSHGNVPISKRDSAILELEVPEIGVLHSDFSIDSHVKWGRICVGGIA